MTTGLVAYESPAAVAARGYHRTERRQATDTDVAGNAVPTPPAVAAPAHRAGDTVARHPTVREPRVPPERDKGPRRPPGSDTRPERRAARAGRPRQAAFVLSERRASTTVSAVLRAPSSTADGRRSRSAPSARLPLVGGIPIP